MHQLPLPQRPTWGGARRDAGPRPSPGRRRLSHHRRPAHDARCPAHITLRVRDDLPSLRLSSIFPVVRSAIAAGSTPTFRVVQFSVQRDHVHLLVEADASIGLARGMHGLTIRIARAVNRTLRRRGRVWGDRYHARLLRTPREVRHALVYVLQNFRKHGNVARGLDPCSSARWFTGWRTSTRPIAEPAPIVPAQTWLASVGWRRLGLLDVKEHPRPRRRAGSPATRAVRKRSTRT